MIPLINNDVQWGRSEVVIIYPGIFFKNEKTSSYWVTQKHDLYYYTMLNFGSLDQLKYSYQQLFMDIHIQIIHIYIYTWLIREAIIHIFIPTMKPAHSNHHGHAFHALFFLVEAFLNGGLLGKSSENWWFSKLPPLITRAKRYRITS